MQTRQAMRPKSSASREMLIAVVAGVGVVLLMIFGVMKLFEENKPAGSEGIITKKTHYPREEQTVTVGAAGVKTGIDKGDFIFTVHLPSLDDSFHVWVDESTYHSYNVGDRYYVARLPKTSEKPAHPGDGAVLPPQSDDRSNRPTPEPIP